MHILICGIVQIQEQFKFIVEVIVTLMAATWASAQLPDSRLHLVNDGTNKLGLTLAYGDNGAANQVGIKLS